MQATYMYTVGGVRFWRPGERISPSQNRFQHLNLRMGMTSLVKPRWTPHTEVVSISNSGDYIRGLAYYYNYAITGWRVHLSLGSNDDSDFMVHIFQFFELRM